MTHRRSTLPVAAGVILAVALTGCSGFGGGGDDESEPGSLTFTTWASESEQAAFEELIAEFESSHEGASVELNVVPYDQMFSNIDAQLSSGEAPDVFRVDYGNLGVYSSQEQLLDLSDYVTEEEADAFTPAFWEAVSYDGVPYGVPHQTDVSALLLNLPLMEAAGITDIPTTLEDAWTWEEFADVAARLRASLPAEQYPFVYNWQLGGTPRWLSWVFQADGALLEDDGTTPAIDSPEAAKALDFTKSFFDNGWVPPTSSVKSATYADAFFTEGTVAMAFAGSFLVPDIDNLADFEWTATPMPVDERGATDLGGNALVATAETDEADLAVEFLEFMASPQNMTAFCAATNELPTRVDIDPADIRFAVRPDVMPVFVEQATTIQPSDVKQLTSPYLAEIAVGMQDQLEQAFVSGQGTDETLAGIAAAVEQATD
ncbi:multiple sugar transport system substrate-binding protein [Diaminobutyricimonas aerilata]|uniref:Multiple sugar transport system substrate-binding protein n=1 Tax=Diaminobutyricimonas aerilata TaxID=1162967 RepID=A0A2M9CGA1_9MICO|nr:sugar ABC transporter substrate-binding protein [Diaminobutyricimonas aerilata]PJJ70954.1 multiple sugar transport system substrate-binding protein [Diaminobutyricimonas aerilata]